MAHSPTTTSDERRRLLGELELERNQLLRNIQFCRIRDIDHPLIGQWNLRDIVGHVTSWEAEVVQAFRDLREGRRPAILDIQEARVDDWNREAAARKRDLPFFTALDELNATRQLLLGLLESVSDDELAAEGSVHARLLHSTLAHDRDHWHELAAKIAGAAGIRRGAPVISLPEEIGRQI